MSKEDILVSAVAVLVNQADILPEFVEEISTTLSHRYANYEVLLIDNGSIDGTQIVVGELLSKYKCIRYLRLTRRTDEETAVMAGLDAAIGDLVVTLHPDFDPPAELISMIQGCQAGRDLVLGVDKQPPIPGRIYRLLRRVFMVLSRQLVRLDFVPGKTGFRAFTRQAVNALVKIRLRRRYFALVTEDLGLTTVIHSYNQISRSGRRPQPNLLRAVRMGTSVLVHNSIVPLRFAGGLGLMGSLLSMLYSLYVVGIYLFKSDVMPGWTTLSLAMSGLFALTFMILALIGEYLGRLLEESIDRPLYHVRDERSSAVTLADLTRRNVFVQSEETTLVTEMDSGK